MAVVLASFEALKETPESAKSSLDSNEMTGEKFCQRVLNPVVESKELLFQKNYPNEEDEELVAVIRKRLQETGTIRVKLEDL